MSNFYASIQGNRGKATRQGHKYISGHIRGWHLGIEVTGRVDKDGHNVFDIYKTGGSSNSSTTEKIATIKED